MTFMTRTLVIFSFLATTASFAFAGDAGCGLGSLIMKKNSRVSQVLAMTTNHSFSSQFLGITTGTSNCSASGLVKNDVEIEKYIASNIHNVKVDMARGEGETLTSLGLMMGCEPSHITMFTQATASEFSNIFTKETTTSSEAYGNLKSSLQKHPTVVSACQLPVAG